MTDSPPYSPSATGSPPKRRPLLRPHRAGWNGSLSSCASSFSSSSSSSSSSPTASPCASPSPLSFSVPFSWERRPGIPKTKSPLSAANPADDQQFSDVVLPLPPPLRSNSDISATLRKKRPDARHVSAFDDDPFAIALAQCAKDVLPASPGAGSDLEELAGKEAARRRRRSKLAALAPATMAGRFRVFHLYGSCKTASTVVEATVRSGPTANRLQLRRFSVDRT